MATTLPPAQRMPLSSSDLRPHLLSPHFFSPASTLSPEPSFPWPASMSPPQQPINNGGQGRRAPSKSSSASGGRRGRGGGSANAGGGFTFITASNPTEFKDKDVMTTVRKRAMGHHLETREESTGKSKENHSETSTPSLTEIGSIHDAPAAASTIPTSASLGTPSITFSQKHASSPVAMRSGRNSQMPSAPTTLESQQLIMDRMPLVCPSRDREDDGTPLLYDRHPMPLFVSLGRPVDPFRTMFQTSNPEVSVENLKYQCSMYFGTKALGRYWIPTALSYPHTFLGSLCLATAYNDVIFERTTDSVATITLRQEVIHLVGRKILNSSDVSDPNMMAIIQLVISEFIGRDEAALKYHEDGIESMVRYRGGLNQLGLEGRLASSISWIALASSIFREERPKPMFVEHCIANQFSRYQPTAMVPESPLYCLHQRRGFETLNKICSPKTLDLLDDMRMMINLFLEGKNTGRRKSLSLPEYYHKICNYPHTIGNDRRYEAVRIAVMIQATAIMQNCPLSQVIQYESDSGPDPKMPPPIFTRSQGFQLEESPVSPFGPQMSSFSESSASPAISCSPAFQIPEYFPTHRPSYSSAGTRKPSDASMDTRGSVSTSITRPSISSSIHSSSDSHFVSFPMPTRQSQQIPEQRLHYLKSVIKTSNLSKCWDDEASVLFWIALVVGAAVKGSQHKLLKQFFSAITMRAGVVLCFEHPEAVNATVFRMTQVVEALSSHETTPELMLSGKQQKRRKT